MGLINYAVEFSHSSNIFSITLVLHMQDGSHGTYCERRVQVLTYSQVEGRVLYDLLVSMRALILDRHEYSHA